MPASNAAACLDFDADIPQDKDAEGDGIFDGYFSDEDSADSDDDLDSLSGAELDGFSNDSHAPTSTSPLPGFLSRPGFNVRAPPPQKRQKLAVPARVVCQQLREKHHKDLASALQHIEKLIRSKCNVFESGHAGLQAYRARAIQSCLCMMLHDGRKRVDTSERAAESQGFAAKWGGRLVRNWVRDWVQVRELPTSQKGRHIKAYTLLSDPTICAELRSYVCSNKWAMDPGKLAEFSKTNLVSTAAKQYLQHLTTHEMPAGLKRYMEIELFPRVHLKVGKGISLRTARRWLHHEGFRYIEHKKSLYYDGHERPDVVHYRQNIFLPAMAQHRSRLVEYMPGDVENEVMKGNCVERRLVTVVHDEMTAQANDGKAKSWVWEHEHAIKKKGVGRGIHQSDVICSTVGWLKDASQSLEYGKNYDGYWNGKLFVKQVGDTIGSWKS
jgi:predicted transcriptional regulator